MVSADFEPWLTLDRRVLRQAGKRVFDPIIAGIDAEPCAFRPYCRWLIERLRVFTAVELLTWPDEDPDEDFVAVLIHVHMTSVELHLDRWIGIVCASMPATATGGKVLSLIERVHRAAAPTRPSLPVAGGSWLRRWRLLR